MPGQPLLDHTGQMLLGLKDLNLHRFAQLFRLLPSRVTKQPSKRPMMLQMTSSVWDMGELFVHLFCHDNETNLILITNYKRCSGHQHGADAHWEKSHLSKVRHYLLSFSSHLLQNYPVSILPDQRQVWDEAKDKPTNERGDPDASHQTSGSVTILLILKDFVMFIMFMLITLASADIGIFSAYWT